MGTSDNADPDEAVTMEKHGITTSNVTYYHYGRYQYTSLSAAVAEAERDKERPAR